MRLPSICFQSVPILVPKRGGMHGCLFGRFCIVTIATDVRLIVCFVESEKFWTNLESRRRSGETSVLDAVVCLSLSVGFCLSLRVRFASHSRAGRQRFSVFLVLTEMRRVHCLIALRPAVVALLSLFSCDCFVFGFALPQTAAHLTHACVHPAAFTCSTSTCRSNRGKSHYALVQISKTSLSFSPATPCC